MNHEQALRTFAVAAYLLDDLTEEERVEFEEHHLACRVCAEDMLAGAAMFVTGRRMAHDLASNERSERDPEVAIVLASIAERLRSMEGLVGPKCDEALRLVEEYAAPYSLVLFYEIERLDEIISQWNV